MNELFKNFKDLFILPRFINKLVQTILKIFPGISLDLEVRRQPNLKGAAREQRVDELIDGLHLKEIIVTHDPIHHSIGPLAGIIRIKPQRLKDVLLL